MSQQIFIHYNQPYGTVKFSIDRIEKCEANENSNDYQKNRAKNGYMFIYGKVIEGSSTSRIFQYTHTEDLKDQDYNLCISPKDLESGYKTTVAM